jgi:hypothetical protein
LLGVSFFAREADVRFDVVRDRSQLIVRGNLFFGAFAVAENSLRFLLIVPKIGLSNAGFERL